jgi:hypothetical protein
MSIRYTLKVLESYEIRLLGSNWSYGNYCLRSFKLSISCRLMYVTGLRKKLRIVVGLLLETLSVARSTCLRKTAGANYRV